MALGDIRDRFQRGLDKRPLTDTIKFDCGEDGAITLRGSEAVLADEPADCTIHISEPNLEKLVAGKLNPMTAFATRKIRVSGDMGVAMKLAQLLK